MDALFDAALGYRVRRAGYLRRAGVTEQTATRDLASLAAVGILAAHGNGRGRYYAAGDPLQRIQERRLGPAHADARSLPVDAGQARAAGRPS